MLQFIWTAMAYNLRLDLKKKKKSQVLERLQIVTLKGYTVIPPV